MKLIEVKSKEDAKKFTALSIALYKNEATWIRPIDNEIVAIFNPKENNHFKNGDCTRWILEDNHKIIGRIAAFVNHRTTTKDNNQPTGGIGFFECINNQEAANTLFDAGKNWLKEKGMEAMDGPINFGDRDKWWGLLTKGFDVEPNYQCNYNFSYYHELFENYGFQNYFDQYTFTRKIIDPINHRLRYKADIIKKDPNYTFEHFRMKKFKKQTKDIISIYNKAWVDHKGVPKMTQEKGEAIINRLKPILEEKIIWLGYYKEEPIAFYFNIPDVNQIIKHVNGKLNLIGKLKFLWYKKFNKNQKMLGIIFGVIPEHQGKGVDGAIILASLDTLHSISYKYPVTEIKGIGDFNRKMILVIKQVGGDICKVHTTYRYLFDRKKPFERMKPIT
jgi:hypothetical protein